MDKKLHFILFMISIINIIEVLVCFESYVIEYALYLLKTVIEEIIYNFTICTTH